MARQRSKAITQMRLRPMSPVNVPPAASLGCAECDVIYRQARQLRAQIDRAFPDGVPLSSLEGMTATKSLGIMLSVPCEFCGKSLAQRDVK
jgi:hypothetical protein